MIIEEISIHNKKYPEQLKHIYNPPKKLYAIGNTYILNQKGIAIVGSRKATEYGKKVTLKISKELSEKGYHIISGLARGIDSYAHIGNINSKSKGKTIAVLGSSLDNIYPKENRNLAIEIIKTGGCIVSEYPIGSEIQPKNFPERNRIISGLSKGVIIIEASEKSGALITADFALEQGRDVFAVPGNIFNENSVGTNDLIKQGAKVVTSFQDILNEIY